MTRANAGRRLAPLLALFCMAASLHGQATPVALHGDGTARVGDSDVPDPVHAGWSATISSSFAHDSSSGWSVLETPALGVRLNRLLSADASLPYYAYVNAVQTRRTGITRVVGHEGVLGDAAVAGHLTLAPSAFSDTATIAVTLPTGDQHLGLGTGRPGYSLSDHAEYNVGPFTPDIEAGVGNTSSLFRRRTRKAYTSSGLLALLQAGSSVDLPYRLGLDLEVYEQLPLGMQTVYSRSPRKRGVVLTQSSDAEDNGVSVELDAPTGPRIALSASYNRSIRLNDTTLGVSLAYSLHANRTR